MPAVVDRGTDKISEWSVEHGNPINLRSGYFLTVGLEDGGVRIQDGVVPTVISVFCVIADV